LALILIQQPDWYELPGDTVIEWMNAVWGPDFAQARAGQLGGAFAGFDFNTRAYRAAEFPFGNMFTSARSLARMYAATVSEIDGVRLLTPATVERKTAVQTDKTRMNGLSPGLDVPADRSFYMPLGFWRACPSMPLAGPASFGHPGSGGSIAFGDPIPASASATSRTYGRETSLNRGRRTWRRSGLPQVDGGWCKLNVGDCTWKWPYL
jgi:hypothetical protein